MANWVTLPVLNDLRFAMDPVPLHRLRLWCRVGIMPARMFGREWRVDLDALDGPKTQSQRKAMAADIVSSILEGGSEGR